MKLPHITIRTFALCAIAALATQWLCGCANEAKIGRLNHKKYDLEQKLQILGPYGRADEKAAIHAQINTLQQRIAVLESEDTGAGIIGGVAAFAGGGGHSPDTAARVTATSGHLPGAAAAATAGAGAAAVGTVSAPATTGHAH